MFVMTRMTAEMKKIRLWPAIAVAALAAFIFILYYPWIDQRILAPSLKAILRIFSKPFFYPALALILILRAAVPGLPFPKNSERRLYTRLRLVDPSGVDSGDYHAQLCRVFKIILSPAPGFSDDPRDTRMAAYGPIPGLVSCNRFSQLVPSLAKAQGAVVMAFPCGAPPAPPGLPGLWLNI
ncbi:MAG: hypothetical protein A3G93_16050 [Nitrospinae bacterium RIFCSPLOWO2_12_FULL_45_22]|nr:MAG: hypothetical protein A3G93_16050 [Nitrospinae bacterium RIFCSPLOWO2_12_FULL_45_22]